MGESLRATVGHIAGVSEDLVAESAAVSASTAESAIALGQVLAAVRDATLDSGAQANAWRRPLPKREPGRKMVPEPSAEQRSR